MIKKRTRTKTRKPKFLSLRLEMSPEKTHQSCEMGGDTHLRHQLDLFPLHPENLVEVVDKDGTTHDENGVHDYFFSAGDGGATTLTGLLGAQTPSDQEDEALTCAYGGQDRRREEGEGALLVRTALRNRERDSSSEEKWVCYSEVTSCAADLRCKDETTNQDRQKLALKLDYEEIMNAWSDKGPLYIQFESPQTVPVLHDDHPPNGIMDGWGSSSGSTVGLWTVPENNSLCSSVKTEKDQLGGDDHGDPETVKMGQREASVLRYKEKRQNRLFSKRIRYQVRKLNAEKRPRIKGRFVKRN